MPYLYKHTDRYGNRITAYDNFPDQYKAINTHFEWVDDPPLSTGTSPSGPPATPVSPTLDPKIEANALYGKPMALFAGGYARIGAPGAPIVGPYFTGGTVDFIVSFGVPANVEGDRKIYKIYLDNELAWSSDAGGTLPAHGTFAAEAFDFIFQPGTLTQPVCSLETDKFPGDECAYRPEMILQIRNIPFARFQEKTGKPVPYVACDIGDVTDGADPAEGINLGLALERVAHSPWAGYTPDTFEAVTITDVIDAILIKDNFTIIDLCQSVTREYRNIDLLVTDKIRVKDRGGSTAPTLTVNRDTVIADDNPISVSRAGATAQRREHELIAIDPDQDYTAVPSLSKIPRDPMIISAAVGKDTATLPLVIDADTRQALATFSQNYEENARKRVAFKVSASGYRVEPGDLFVLVDILNGIDNEVFKCTQTTHGANWMVDVEGEAVLKCSIYRSSPGNGLFVAGSLICDMRWCFVAGPTTQRWQGAWMIEPFWWGNIVASSYAKPGGVPTMVLAGNDFFWINFGKGIIMSSHDGRVWTPVYTSSTRRVIYAVVWDADEQAFYANWRGLSPIPGSDIDCLRSADGYTWEEVVGNFWDHTADGVTPDGKVGFDPDQNVQIKPSDLTLSFMDRVRCVAFADGIWMAAGRRTPEGGAVIGTSLDGGATWSMVSSGSVDCIEPPPGLGISPSASDTEIYTMIGVPQADLP